MERHHASVLVVGSHGYGAIKRGLSYNMLSGTIPPIPRNLTYTATLYISS
ncbi:hypothetical protein OROMI_002456 [Orobanche minor]